MSQLECTLVSAEGQLFKGSLKAIIATSVQGDLGVYPGHAPLLAMLNPGPIRLIDVNEEEKIFFLSGGFLEVQPDQVFILADSSKRQEQLSEEAIEKTRQQALEALKDAGITGESRQEASALLANATAQLRTLREVRRRLGKHA